MKPWGNMRMFEQGKLKVAIIDFGMGNLFSVKQACQRVGLNALITDRKDEVLESNGVILPGVGAFGNAMANLHRLDLVEPLKDFVKSERPVLGICLGMQLLMSESEEFGIHKGLDIIDGRVVRFHDKTESGQLVKVPQVGWNKISVPGGDRNDLWSGTPLEGIVNGTYMYFVHSYYAKPEDPKVVASVTRYGNLEYCSALRYKSVFATQFHPERSAIWGIRIYKNWALQVLKQCEIKI